MNEWHNLSQLIFLVFHILCALMKFLNLDTRAFSRKGGQVFRFKISLLVI